jgi:hypothetical protein
VLYRRLEGIPRAELERRYSFLATLADCAVDVGLLVHLHALYTARLSTAVQRAEVAATEMEHEVRRMRRARVAAWVAVGVAVAASLLSLVRG